MLNYVQILIDINLWDDITKIALLCIFNLF